MSEALVHWPDEPLVTNLRDVLEQWPDIGAVVDGLEPLNSAVRPFLQDRFLAAWTRPPDWPQLVRLAAELACLIATTGRDPKALQQDLKLAVRRGHDGATILDTLLPAARPHLVVCVVLGTNSLKDLTRFEPSAQQRTLREADQIAWGPSTRRLRECVGGIERSGAACVVSVEVDAVDKPSAARQVRRAVTELLDQYIAGQRLLTLTLHPDILVTRSGVLDTQQCSASRSNVATAWPLVHDGPDELRRALRMAHQARVVDSPVAATALAWSALEACGLEDRDQPAKALSL